ncbi:MAG: polysaccharide biosynthesis protein [Cyclobacteriaceae bacterium]|nr:polysaccharide biosynthesis protein [Cyclobacteriaceae bacterium]MCO5273053.1 polysaccharide biosynthesis protein [Cyclobacteriaceae bacterium]MCW5903288.1 polysaccharide biosynthesis protein [Cyclobacteriaceae bacterium]
MIVSFVQNLKILPRWVIIFIDLFFIGFSCILAYFIRFNFNTTDFAANNYWEGTALYLLCALLSILATSSYKGIIRYTGLEDSVRIFYMVALNMLLVGLANLVYYYNYKSNIIPFSVVLITFLSSFLLLFNYRLLVKHVFSYYKDAILKNFRVLIFGAGQTGIVARHVINSTPRMQVVGFLEDDVNKIGKVLDGARIYEGSPGGLDALVKNLHIDELVIAVKDISLDRKNELVDVCIRNKVKVRTIPAVEKWVRGELSYSQIREINIEELLGRESIKLDNDNVKKDLVGKRVLISGAAGSIGAELVRQVVLYGPSLVVLVDQAESAMYELEREIKDQNSLVKIIPYLADITNAERLEYVFKEFQPDLVYHAAAYKHVPMMESNPSEAVSCNILGTKALADMAVKYKVKKFVMISTDKAVNPTNVMGCSKRIAEIYVQSLNNHLSSTGMGNTVFVTTRFGNVLGSNGSVIPLFKKQIKEGGPVTVTHPEITRFFMTIPEACQLVLEAGTMGKGGEIFIFDMGKAIKILDLAKKMVRLSGYEPDRDVPIVFTGIREGEKLYEELLTTTENTLPTHHSKILIAKVQEYGFTEINKFVDLFHELVYDKNELKMVALMKELVPEYKSNYSRYEVLDKEPEGM